MIVVVSASFLLPSFRPLYAMRVTRYYNQQNKVDHQNEFLHDDIILENRKYKRHSRTIRMLISFFATTALLAISGVGTFALVVLRENVLGDFLAATAVALLLRVVHTIWRKICTLLTEFEKHRHGQLAVGFDTLPGRGQLTERTTPSNSMYRPHLPALTLQRFSRC